MIVDEVRWKYLTYKHDCGAIGRFPYEPYKLFGDCLCGKPLLLHHFFELTPSFQERTRGCNCTTCEPTNEFHY